MKTQTKKILLSVTGMSPAVVTETLYALVTEKNFIPTEIQVITTIQGKNKLLSTLLGVEGGRKESKGALAEFIEDYGKQYGFSEIHFDESCIHIIEDKCGEKLPDIRTPEENECAADNIVKLVGTLCQDENTQLHISIAGGRKTMGFFMGYALSLYGREQDSMSHILVDEKFENLPNFYYRKPYPYIIINRDGTELDASQANIMLAEIPWVRLGLGLSNELLDGKISYSNSISKAQQILEKPSLTFLHPIDDQKVRFGNTEIKLSPKEYSFLLSLVIAKQKNIAYSLFSREIFTIYLAIYTILKGSPESLEKRVKFVKNETDFAEETKKIYSESCHHLGKKIKTAFSIGNNDTPYIPSSSHQCYELFIDMENIDISPILPDLHGKI